MKCTLLERRLLTAYRQAIRQGLWVAAEHVLTAIEALAPPDAAMSESVTEAYLEIATVAQRPENVPATGSSHGA